MKFRAVFERPKNSDAKAGGAFAGERAAVGAPDAHLEFDGAGAAGELAREEVDVAIGSGVEALDPAVGDVPVLEWIGPVFRAEPHAIKRAVPRATEGGGGFAGVQERGEARGE